MVRLLFRDRWRENRVPNESKGNLFRRLLLWQMMLVRPRRVGRPGATPFRLKYNQMRFARSTRVHNKNLSVHKLSIMRSALQNLRIRQTGTRTDQSRSMKYQNQTEKSTKRNWNVRQNLLTMAVFIRTFRNTTNGKTFNWFSSKDANKTTRKWFLKSKR